MDGTGYRWRPIHQLVDERVSDVGGRSPRTCWLRLDLRSRQVGRRLAFLPNALAFEALASSIALIPSTDRSYRTIWAITWCLVEFSPAGGRLLSAMLPLQRRGDCAPLLARRLGGR